MKAAFERTAAKAGQRPLAYTLAGVAVGLVLLLALSSSSGSGASDRARITLSPHGSGSGKGVERFIVKDIIAALAADLRAAGVAAAVVPSPSCYDAMALVEPLRDAGIATTCVARPADDPGPVAAAGAAVVRLTRTTSPPDLARRLLTVQLVRAGAAGGPAVYAEVAVNESSTAVRAGALHFGSGVRRVWVLNSRAHLDTFNKIYEAKSWGAWGGGSGEGSTLEYTANIRAALLDVLRRHNIKSMLDSSCGSMLWMPLALREYQKQVPDFKFYGSDVVCSLIDGHKVKYASEANWQFGCHDYAHQPLPSGYELIWSRDSLQHVPFNSVWQFLANAKATGAKYLLVGSYIKGGQNFDIQAGEYYAVNLLQPPFNLKPAPLEVIDEKTKDGKHMLLFDLQALQWDDDLTGI
ncbi:hypothetical protein Rsub_01565 [Raphidocelis subcapitata]|uniref:Uncharacterized protein n=1 Tax=Raphidocelis subcapitata TaxID=307507 RepID=A0A2V0NME6_9CHLO|nr:hypothetical protein Rsub_01565 [Raphidocelis subcapitata]|eukprot:GBF88666.1 hypothetical protein Rsub_01565 [Raphidocelis subcapitata]